MTYLVQRNIFYRMVIVLTLVMLWLPWSLKAQLSEKRTTFHNNKLSIALDRDWKIIERPNMLLACASEDETSSMFISIARYPGASTMEEVLTNTITNFEKTFKVLEVGEYKSGKIKGPGKEWKAIFATLELEWEGKPRDLPFRFYLTMFETDSTLYLIQGSVQKPVNPNREKEILAMIRSVVALP